MVIQISENFNMLDVLDAFPVVRTTLVEDLHFSLNDVREGETVERYFERKSLGKDEILFVLRKINHKLKSFMTKKEEIKEEKKEFLVSDLSNSGIDSFEGMDIPCEAEEEEE